jgi:ABC-type sugar transport system ATPase subunit
MRTTTNVVSVPVQAIHFDARILIMDEPTAALGPAETAQVRTLIHQRVRCSNVDGGRHR